VKDFGFMLRPQAVSQREVQIEVERVTAPVNLAYRLATETSPGEIKEINLGTLMNSQQISEFICTQIPNLTT
jgi:hypothetical protein